jgi:hypothetical protein
MILEDSIWGMMRSASKPLIDPAVKAYKGFDRTELTNVTEKQGHNMLSPMKTGNPRIISTNNATRFLHIGCPIKVD